MQSRFGYFMMGLGVAYFFQSVLKKRAGGASQGQTANARGSNVIDLVAWRRHMSS